MWSYTTDWCRAAPVLRVARIALPLLQTALALGFRVRACVCAAGLALQLAGAVGAVAATGASAAAMAAAVEGRTAEVLTSALTFGLLLPLSIVFKLEQHDRDRFSQQAPALRPAGPAGT